MGTHAFLAPSAAAVWMRCAGSAAIQRAYPDPPDKPAAREGTAAHWAARERIYGQPVAVGQVADNGVVVDEEMLQAAEDYAECILADLAKDPMTACYCEQPISIATIHEANRGTPDFWGHRPGFIRLYDFKYGHDFVEVFENWQLIDYSAGIIDFLNLDGLQDQNTIVEFVIFQPRSFHPDGTVRRWRVRASDLRGPFNLLRTAAIAAMKPDAPVTTGPQCEYCSASNVCPALLRDSMRNVDVSAKAIPFQLTAVQAGHELRAIERALDILEARKRGLVEQVDSHLTRGETVPFYQVGNGRGGTVWKKTAAEVISHGQLWGVNLAKPQAAITPTQAKELRIDPALIDGLSEYRPGKRQVIRINPLSVKKAFSNDYSK